MAQLFNFITANLGLILASLVCVIIILVLLIIILFAQISRLNKKYKSFMSGTKGLDLEHLLENYIKRVFEAESNVKQMEASITKLEKRSLKSLQKMSLVRFDAFENVGGELSFAIALLDLQGDGLVISSINSREESRVYAKPVSNGVSKFNLSEEEKTAVKTALNN